jgi:hypothetical protein
VGLDTYIWSQGAMARRMRDGNRQDRFDFDSQRILLAASLGTRQTAKLIWTLRIRRTRGASDALATLAAEHKFVTYLRPVASRNIFAHRLAIRCVRGEPHGACRNTSPSATPYSNFINPCPGNGGK